MNEVIVLIALTQIKGVGIKLIQKLRKTFSTLMPLTDPQSYKRLPSVVREKLAPFPQVFEKAHAIYEKSQQAGVEFLPFWDSKYPPLLQQIPQPPPILYVRGKSSFHNRCISIVGTRKATPYGLKVTQTLSEILAAKGYVVVSGLAYGVDTQAHKSALQAGGQTWAVLAHGLDKIYPTKNKELAHQITYSGALLTEYPLGTALHPLNFPHRNRIIAGISLATIVVESDVKGGALTTAQWAFHFNRYVYAVPGGIFSPQSRGTHTLIQKQLAEILVSPEQILIVLEKQLPQLTLPLYDSNPIQWQNPTEKKVYEAIPAEGIDREELASRIQIPFSQLAAYLTIMEVKGLIALRPGGKVFRA